MVKTKNFIKGLGLSALLTFAASCSNNTNKSTPKGSSNIACAILNQAQNQAKDLEFMTETDHIFTSNANLIYRDDFSADYFIEYHQTDSAKYAAELIRDASRFPDLSAFNKRLDLENNGAAEDFVYINYRRYRRAVALLNAAREEMKKRQK